MNTAKQIFSFGYNIAYFGFLYVVKLLDSVEELEKLRATMEKDLEVLKTEERSLKAQVSELQQRIEEVQFTEDFHSCYTLPRDYPALKILL